MQEPYLCLSFYLQLIDCSALVCVYTYTCACMVLFPGALPVVSFLWRYQQDVGSQQLPRATISLCMSKDGHCELT